MKLNDMLQKANKKLNLSSDSIDSPWQLASNPKDSQTIVKGTSYDSQTIVKGTSNDSQTIVKSTSNDSQTIVKGTSNDSQTIVKGTSNDSQTIVKGTSNDSQMIVKDTSNDSQTIVKGTSNDSQTIVKGTSNDSQTIVKGTSNDSQTIVKKNSKICIDNLSGLQLDIINYFIKNIENESLRTTTKMTIPLMSQSLQSTKNMLVQGIYRLKKKGFIYLVRRKDGRGGWCQYKLHKEITITPIYNNDINIINKKETIKTNSESLQPQTDKSKNDWLNIDFSPLSNFGFRKSHITQLSQIKNLTPEMIQESILHFAWALNNNLDEMIQKYDERFEKNKLGLLIGTLKKGNEWIEAGYKSPEDIAQAEILKAKKVRLEKIKQQKLEMFETDFELWYEELTKEDRNKVESSFAAPVKSMGEKMLKEGYKSYFKKNIYES